MACICCGAKTQTRYCAACETQVAVRAQEIIRQEITRRPIVSGGHGLRQKKVTEELLSNLPIKHDFILNRK